jgi:hypothetical protein
VLADVRSALLFGMGTQPNLRPRLPDRRGGDQELHDDHDQGRGAMAREAEAAGGRGQMQHGRQ